MTPNVELFRKIYTQITEHPETHDQYLWESQCGTTRCVAGWALHFTDPSRDVMDTAARMGMYEGEAAASILELSPSEADHLFLYTSDDQAVALVKKYAGLC